MLLVFLGVYYHYETAKPILHLFFYTSAIRLGVISVVGYLSVGFVTLCFCECLCLQFVSLGQCKDLLVARVIQISFAGRKL